VFYFSEAMISKVPPVQVESRVSHADEGALIGARFWPAAHFVK